MSHFSELTAYERDVLQAVSDMEGKSKATVRKYLRSESKRVIHRSGFYKTASKLEEKELLVSQEIDDRRKSLELTEDGRSVLRQVNSWHDERKEM